VVKDGYRIKVIDAEFISGGPERRARHLPAAAQDRELARQGLDAGAVGRPKPADIPAPDMKPMGGMWQVRRSPAASASPACRAASGWPRCATWWRAEPFTPFARVATGADFVSPFANSGDQGLGYINSDVTLYLHREPVSEWVGYDVVNHGATDGVAIAECLLYDEAGAIGSASCTALAQTRKVS
jgi:hypothetical protein